MTKHPHRAITITIGHPTVGDDYFAPLVFDAMQEWLRRDPYDQRMEFTASNGVTISVANVPRELPDGNVLFAEGK